MKRQLTFTIGLCALVAGIATGTTNSLFSSAVAYVANAPTVNTPQEEPDGPTIPGGPTVPEDPDGPTIPGGPTVPDVPDGPTVPDEPGGPIIPGGPVDPPSEDDDPAEEDDEAISMDYSTLVVEGNTSKIKWYTSKKFPFSIDGNHAVSSNQGEPSSISWMEGEFDLDGNYKLSFLFDVSTKNVRIDMFSWNMDTGRIIVDGQTISSFLDKTSKEINIELEQGIHKVRIEYSKDYSGDYEEDCASVTDFKLVEIPNDFKQLCDGDDSFGFTLPAKGFAWTCFKAMAKPANKGIDASEASFDIDVTGDDPYSVVFDYEMLSEKGHDEFTVYVDGEPAFTESGRKIGKFTRFFPHGGSHIIKCVYAKDKGNTIEGELVKITSLRKYVYEFKEEVHKYTAVAHTSFDDALNFSAGTSVPVNFGTTFRFYDDGDVIIDALMNFPDNIIESYPIRTRINTEGNILFDNINFYDSRIICGKRLDLSSELEMELMAGEYTSDGMLYPSDNLLLSIAPDKSYIAVPCGLGLGAGEVHAYYNDIYYVTDDGKGLIWGPERLSVPYIYKDDLKKVSFTVTNSGTGDAVCTLSCGEDPGVVLEYDKNIIIPALGGRIECTVNIRGVREGSYTIPVKLSCANGNELTVELTGEILPELNYNNIVLSGEEYIDWSSSEDYPWNVVHDKAISGNSGIHGSKSRLRASFDIPVNHVGILKSDLSYSIGMGNTFTISNGEEIWGSYRNSFFSTLNEEKFERRMNKGHYDIDFEYDRTNDISDPYTDEVTLYNLSLVILELKEDGVWMPEDVADFGTVEAGETVKIPFIFL